MLQEEEYLRERFGKAYERYCHTVGRYGPRMKGQQYG
jgi:protein-S-isoprenylcysteine O-methyltransferase Ste14